MRGINHWSPDESCQSRVRVEGIYNSTWLGLHLLESTTTWSGDFGESEARAVHLRNTTPNAGICTNSENVCELDDECYGGALCDGVLDN